MGELIITVPWSRERLENERDASIFISQNTTIRVPKFLDFSVESDIASISMEAVDGDPMDELAKSLNSEDQKTLTSNVFTYINDTVLPQSNRLRSGTLGSVRGKIVPPYRLQERDGRPHWLSRTSISKGYVYCHNDLAQHNILINPETLQVAAIIDWEFSGFYPQGFEFPFWLEPRGRIRQADEEDEEDPAVENLIKLIVEPGKTTHILTLQLSPALTAFRCQRTSCAPMGSQSDSPARNFLGTFFRGSRSRISPPCQVSSLDSETIDCKSKSGQRFIDRASGLLVQSHSYSTTRKETAVTLPTSQRS